MSIVWSLLVFVSLSHNEKAPEPYFENYTDAYSASKLADKPILVVLNPSKDSSREMVQYDEIAKTEQRRKFLKNYVVVIVDTGSSHGKIVKDLFKNPKLPRVVVIDKKREYQIFQSSRNMNGQRWDEVLKTYRNGEIPKRVASRRASYSGSSSADCYT